MVSGILQRNSSFNEVSGGGITIYELGMTGSRLAVGLNSFHHCPVGDAIMPCKGEVWLSIGEEVTR